MTKESRFLAVVEDPLTMVMLCERVASGETLKDIASGWEVSPGRLARWLGEDAKRYEVFKRALEFGSYELVSQAVAISDDVPEEETSATVNRSRLRVETRLRVAAAHNRAVYGEAPTSLKSTSNSVTVVVDRAAPLSSPDGPSRDGPVIDAEANNG